MSPFDHLPAFEAGCRMPSHNSILIGDSYEYAHARMGSDRLLAALLIYGAKHGLPNIAADQCRAKLRCMRPISTKVPVPQSCGLACPSGEGA